MLQFGSKHVCIEDVHIFKHCHEMKQFLLWIGPYCISCVVQQTSGVKHLSSLVRYDDSCLAAIRSYYGSTTTPTYTLPQRLVYVLSRLPGVCLIFKDELEARKSLKAFFYSQNYN